MKFFVISLIKHNASVNQYHLLFNGALLKVVYSFACLRKRSTTIANIS